MTRPIALLLLVVGKIVLQYLLVHPAYELHRDEFLHLDQANYLAWGYMSVPPFTSWNSLLIQWLGNTEFWVRFFPALYGALTIVVVWKLAESLGGKWFACVFSSLAVTFSVVFRLNMLYQPNSFDVLAWTFVYFSVIRFIQTRKIRWVYVGSIALALGILNKYNIGFLVLGLLPGILLTPQRRLLTDKRIYPALALTILIVLPNLIWQINNDLPVVHHLETLARTQLHRLTALNFLKEQLLFFVGSFYAILAALFALLIHPAFKPYRFVLFSFLITIGLFIFFKAKGYYAVGLYPVLLAFGAVYIERLLQSGFKRHFRFALALVPVLAFVPLTKLIFPVDPPEKIQTYLADFEKIGMLTWEDGKRYNLPQDFADMLGWQEMATLADSAVDLAGDTTRTLIMCDNYGQAGAINYYSRHKGMAFSFHADYLGWIPTHRETKNVVVVVEAGGDSPNDLFNTVTRIGSVTHPYAREKGTSVYLAQDPKVDLDSVVQTIRNTRIF